MPEKKPTVCVETREMTTVCPKCGHTHEMTTGIDFNGDAPVPCAGDIHFCTTCGSVNQFTEGEGVVLEEFPDWEQELSPMTCHNIRMAIEAVKRTLKEHGLT